VCFAWCVVISGIAVILLNTAFLSSLYRVGPHQLGLIIGIMRLLMIFSERDLFTPVRSNFRIDGVQAWIHDNIRSTEDKYHCVHAESNASDLDNILAVILMLLLISGDVELNPGPNDRKINSSQPSSHAGAAELDPPVTPKDDNSHDIVPPNASNLQQSPTIASIPEDFTQASSQGIEDRREVMITDSKNLLTPKEGDIKIFKEQAEEDTPDDLQGTNYGRPIEEVREYDVVTPDPTFYRQKITISDEGLQEAPDFSMVEHCQSKSEFTRILNEELDSVSARFNDSFAKDDLDDCTRNFFSHANKLFRAGCRCHYCSICGSYKKDDTRDSHIFPEGLLTVFRRIHVYNAKPMKSDSGKSKHEAMPKEFTEFIYDFVLDKRFGTSAWTYDLLCASCELKCSPAEQLLRNAYVRMMKTSSFSQPLLVSNKNCWFHFILAMIMFRGLLVSEKLSDHFTDPMFQKRFTELWNFCKLYLNPQSAAVCSIPDLRLFLLPNQAINIEMIHFLYSLEYSLRCPMFTRHIRSSENGTFFYWKFDCLHVVLALDSISERYFNCFQHSLDLRGAHKEYLMLQWINMKCSEVTRCEPSGAVRIECMPDLKQHIFPPMLFEENVDLNNEFFKRIYDQATVVGYKFNILPSSKVMTSRFCGFGHSYPLTEKVFSPTEARCMEQYPVADYEIDSEFIDANNIGNEELDKYIEAANDLSPLLYPERNAELKRENESLKAQMAAMGKDGTSVNELIQSKQEIDRVKKNHEDLKKKYRDKQKGAGVIIVKLKESLKREEGEVEKEKERATAAEKRAEIEGRRAEEALLEKDKLYFENQELKQCIYRYEKMMQRELRLSQNQLTHVQSLGHRSREHFSVRNAQTMILTRMEFMEQQYGLDFSIHKEFCQKVLTYVEIETSQESDDTICSMIFSSLEYLDLSIKFSKHKSSKITEAYCPSVSRSTSY
jgi:hypothetical protein